MGLLSGSDGSESTCNARDLGLFPELGRSPGGGHGNHSSIISWRIAWTKESGRLQRVRHDWATKHSTAQTYVMEKKMATHSIILAWKIPRTEESGGYSPWGRSKSDRTEQLSIHIHMWNCYHHQGHKHIHHLRTSLVVQWLRLWASNVGVRVWSLVGELISRNCAAESNSITYETFLLPPLLLLFSWFLWKEHLT